MLAGSGNLLVFKSTVKLRKRGNGRKTHLPPCSLIEIIPSVFTAGNVTRVPAALRRGSADGNGGGINAILLPPLLMAMYPTM
jgi:hypothetical protein